MQWRPGGDVRVIIGQLRAEVQAFFEVRLSLGEFPPHWKVPAPCRPSKLHADGELLFERFREELSAERFQAAVERLVHAVSDNVEKAGLPAGVADCLRRARAVGPRDQRGDINDWKGVHRGIPPLFEAMPIVVASVVRIDGVNRLMSQQSVKDFQGCRFRPSSFDQLAEDGEAAERFGVAVRIAPITNRGDI